jgi:hypothetical protein
MSASMQADTSTPSPVPVPVWATSSEEGSDVGPIRVLPSPAAITCQPWCQANDGHPNQRSREDQCCYGLEHRVPLLKEPMELIGNGSTQQQYLSTYLMRTADDTESRVLIGYNEAPGRSATLDEAQAFALEILALVNGVQL